MSSIVEAWNCFPGSSFPNDRFGSVPNFKPLVLESPIMHVEFLFSLSTDLKVRLYRTPSAIDPGSMRCLNISWLFLVIEYTEQGLHSCLWTHASLESRNSMAQPWPSETVTIVDSGWIAGSLSECKGREDVGPLYLLTRQLFTWGMSPMQSS